MTKGHDVQFDAVLGDNRTLAEIKFSVNALRTVRMAVIQLAHALREHPTARAYLVLVDPSITETRLGQEWENNRAILNQELVNRILLCIMSSDGQIRGIPHAPPTDVADWLREVVNQEGKRLPKRAQRINYEFVVLKLLILQWLTKREPVTVAWLTETAGCSYPTVSGVLKRLGLGSLVERRSNRRITLRYFPTKEFEWLVANSERARSTTRFVDVSGQPRDPLSHLSRIEKLKPSGVAIGGVLGAKHYDPSLDIVGVPRLDISVHCHDSRFDIDFVKRLDPALRLQEDPLGPANVVVHAVKHKDSLFLQRQGLLPIADPLECLLDLHEARLETQANQFLSGLQSERRTFE